MYIALLMRSKKRALHVNWVHPTVIAPKAKGDIRVCIDPKALSVHIKRKLFHILAQQLLLYYLNADIQLKSKLSKSRKIPLGKPRNINNLITPYE